MKQNVLSKIDALQARLDDSKSDPKWLNDAVADIRQAVEDMPDQIEGEPISFDFDPQDLVLPPQAFVKATVAQILAEMMGNIPPLDLQTPEPLHKQRVQMRIANQVRWAHFAATQAAAVLYPENIVDDEPEDEEPEADQSDVNTTTPNESEG